MNNLEEMKTYTDYHLKDIEMTDASKNKVFKAINKKQSITFKKIAAIFLPLFLILVGLSTEPIGYAIEKVLSYLPGTSMLFSEESDKAVYGLLGSVKVVNNAYYLKINSAFIEGNQLTFTIDGNIPLNNDFDKNLQLISNHNEIGKLMGFDRMVDSENNQWSGRYVYEFKKSSKQFNLVYEDLNLPLVLSTLPKLPFDAQNYISAPSIKADFAAISNDVNDFLEITLLSGLLDAHQNIIFPMSEIYLMDESGQRYFSQSFKDNKLYFDRKLEGGIRLVIPYVFVEDLKVSSPLKISSEMHLPSKLSLGQHQLMLKDFTLEPYTQSFNYRKPRQTSTQITHKAQSLTLYFEKEIDASLFLESVSITASPSQLKAPHVDGVKVIWDDPYQEQSHEDKIPENLMTVSVFNLDETLSAFDLSLSHPIYRLEQEISIPLRP